MKDEIKEIIEKHLPAQVGDTLKSVLEQGKRDAEKVKIYEDQIEKLKKTISDQQNELSEYSKLDQRNNNLDLKEKQLDEKERKLKIETLEYQLTSEKEKTEFTKQVALGLVRNSVYRRKLYDNVNEPAGVDQYGNTVYANKMQNSEETKTED